VSSVSSASSIFFSIISMGLGAVALLVGLGAIATFGWRAVRHLVGRRPRLARGYAALAAGCLIISAVCYFLISSQPPEWPWAPAFAPVFLIANVLFVLFYRHATRLDKSAGEHDFP
jgi:peptidoglycan/LPS O-acetylase OafA/YrhL